MADEKIIRIGADASGFGNEINRMGESAKKAFSDIGLDTLFDAADKQFDKISDKIANVTEELKRKQQEANEVFNQDRGKNQGNAYYQSSLNNDQENYNKRHDKATAEWEKFVEKLKKVTDKNNPETGDGGVGARNPTQDMLKKAFGDAGGNIGQSIGNMFPGQIGRTIGNLLGRGGASIGQSLAGGIGGSSTIPSAAEAAAGTAGRGAAGMGGAGAAGGLLAAGAVVAVVAAVAIAIKQLYGMGMDDWRTESKVNSTFNIDRDSFGKGGDDFGMDNKEYKEFFLQSAKSRGLAEDIEDIGRKQLSLIRGYGLNENEVRTFDKFNYQETNNRDGTTMIFDILSRSEKQGILGVSNGDFSRLPEKIEQVGNIMSMQKMSGEKVDSISAINFMSAGSKIGGRFGDDRASEVYGRMNESIKNPSNPGMKAYIFEMLKKSNPGASFTDLQGMMENGASGDNLKAILPSISKMPQGEMRRMVLFQLTKNMQDAIRLDGAGNLDTMMKEADSKGISSGQVQSKYDEAMKRTETNLAAMDQLGKIIENKLTDFGEKYIARPLNDMTRGMMQGNGADFIKAGTLLTQPYLTPFIQGGFNSNTGGKQNAVTPKGK